MELGELSDKACPVKPSLLLFNGSQQRPQIYGLSPKNSGIVYPTCPVGQDDRTGVKFLWTI